MLRILIVFCFFCIFGVFSKSLELDINAKNAVLINADNNAVLFAKDETKKIYPASLTKVFTLWYIVENYADDLNKTFEASKKALEVVAPEKKIASKYSLKPYILETDGVSFDLIQGEKLTLKDLLFGMMIVSGNDASNVIAENISGTIDAFMEDLNEFIKKNDLNDTFLCNPHGLHIPQHMSTALDIARMIKYAIKSQHFMNFFSCKFFIRPKTNKQNKKDIITYNKILKPGEHFYKYAIGSKSGYHAKAKYNLVTVAKKDERTLIAVVLGCSNPDARFEDTKKLFDTAFLEKKQIKKVIDKEKVFRAKILGGSKILKSCLKKDLKIEYFPAEEVPLKAFVIYDYLKAPIKKGQKVATIEIKTEDRKVIEKENLYAIENVKRGFFYFLKNLFIKS